LHIHGHLHHRIREPFLLTLFTSVSGKLHLLYAGYSCEVKKFHQIDRLRIETETDFQYLDKVTDGLVISDLYILKGHLRILLSTSEYSKLKIYVNIASNIPHSFAEIAKIAIQTDYRELFRTDRIKLKMDLTLQTTEDWKILTQNPILGHQIFSSLRRSGNSQ
jgi:hypothetical protein